MNKKVKAFKIGTENCEVFSIKPEHVKNVYFDGVTSFKMVKGYFQDKEMISYYQSKSSVLKLDEKANKDFVNLSNFEPYEDGLFERLTRFFDIVDIMIVYEDGSEENIYVPYGGDRYETNTYQSSLIDEKGSLLLVFDEELNASEIPPS